MSTPASNRADTTPPSRRAGGVATVLVLVALLAAAGCGKSAKASLPPAPSTAPSTPSVTEPPSTATSAPAPTIPAPATSDAGTSSVATTASATGSTDTSGVDTSGPGISSTGAPGSTSGSSGSPSPTAGRTTGATGGSPKTTVVPRVVPPPSGTFVGLFGPFQVQPLGDAQQAGINQAVDAYVQAASIAPLVGGGTANLASFLTAATVQQVAGSPSRATLTDESVATAPDAQVSNRSVQLDGFVGPDGAAVANATIDITITSASAGLSIHRTGLLTFLAEGGTWKIDSFDLHVERSQ